MDIKQYVEYNGLMDATYIGDGVYAAHDGYQVWLITQHYDEPAIAIALPPRELAVLMNYWARVTKPG